MSSEQTWSFQNRLGSAAGLIVLAIIFGVVAFWLGKAASAAKSDREQFIADRSSNASRTWYTPRGPGDRGTGMAMVYLGAGTAITGGIACLSLVGAGFVLLMRSPPKEGT